MIIYQFLIYHNLQIINLNHFSNQITKKPPELNNYANVKQA